MKANCNPDDMINLTTCKSSRFVDFQGRSQPKNKDSRSCSYRKKWADRVSLCRNGEMEWGDGNWLQKHRSASHQTQNRLFTVREQVTLAH